jgi:hypothetical protein
MTAQNRSTSALWNVVVLTVAGSPVRKSGASTVPNVPNIGTTEGRGTMALTLQIRPVRVDDAQRLVAFDGQSVLYAVEVSQ